MSERPVAPPSESLTPAAGLKSAARKSALTLASVTRAYKTGSGPLVVLKGAAISVAVGEMVALVAPSGAGKSTLLHIAGLLEHPDSGDVFIVGEMASKLGDDARTRYGAGRLSAVRASSPRRDAFSPR